MYVQCFEVRCHACILTLFWNIGPFHFVELFLGMSLFMCLKSYAKICLSCHPSYPSHLKEEIPDPFLKTFFSKKCMICHCFLSCSYQCFNLFFIKLRAFWFYFSTKIFSKEKKSLKVLALWHDQKIDVFSQV